METQQNNEAKGETLNESWVELHFQSQLAAPLTQPQNQGTDSPPHPTFSRPLNLNTQMEKLLLEAQRDSSRSSRSSSVNVSITSSRGSPKSPHSPNNESTTGEATIPYFPGIPEASQEGAISGTDWIWEWSSRPEALPPSDWGSRFKHPKRHKLSVRNTRVMSSGLFRLENLPTLLLTHACSFLMGAAVMFIYLKKYCHWTVITTPTMD